MAEQTTKTKRTPKEQRDLNKEELDAFLYWWNFEVLGITKEMLSNKNIQRAHKTRHINQEFVDDMCRKLETDN